MAHQHLVATVVGIFLAACAAGPPADAEVPTRTSVEPPRPAGGVHTVDGEVLGVERVPVAEQNNLTLRLRVEPGQKKPIVVNLGPGWYFEQNGIVFRPNDRVQVSGSTDHDHSDVMEAHEVTKDGKTYRRNAGQRPLEWQPIEPDDEKDDAAEPSEEPGEGTTSPVEPSAPQPRSPAEAPAAD